MNRFLDDPVRLRDQHDQLSLVERIAGQAARDLVDRAQLSSTAMARIAHQIAATQMHSARPAESLRFGWVLVIGALLLGIVTAASAAHLAWLPRWITRNVQDKPKRVSHLATPGAAKTRPFARTDQPLLPATAATPCVSAPFADPIPEPTSASVPAAKPLAKKRLGGEPRKPPSGAMRDDEPGRIPVATGHPLPHVDWPVGSFALPAEGAVRPPIASPPPVAEGRPPEQQAVPPPAPLRQRTDMETLPGLPPHSAPLATLAPSRSASTNLPATVRAERSSAAVHASMYLKEIVRALRIDHSPSQALALLDRYASELAGSAFAEESLLLRVEAMLALGQRTSVLHLLDRTSLTDVAASRNLLITRGELRAAANRCAEGIGDFDLVLTDARRPPKKALLGRALCKQKLGDTAGATADFDRFRREFPDDPVVSGK